MKIPVKRLMDEIDAEEFAWWRIYDQLEPITGVSDVQMAQIGADLVGVQVARGHRPRVVDYLPRSRYEEAPQLDAVHTQAQTAEQQFAILRRTLHLVPKVS